MLYMLDTNICIYLLSGVPPSVLHRFNALSFGDAVISVITLAELRAGLEMRPDLRHEGERALSALLEDLPVLSFDAAAAVDYGVLRAAIRDRRRDALDRLIAAHAISAGATLVTNNEADFRDYPGLVVENWVLAG